MPDQTIAIWWYRDSACEDIFHSLNLLNFRVWCENNNWFQVNPSFRRVGSVYNIIVNNNILCRYLSGKEFYYVQCMLYLYTYALYIMGCSLSDVFTKEVMFYGVWVKCKKTHYGRMRVDATRRTNTPGR